MPLKQMSWWKATDPIYWKSFFIPINDSVNFDVKWANTLNAPILQSVQNYEVAQKKTKFIVHTFFNMFDVWSHSINCYYDNYIEEYFPEHPTIQKKISMTLERILCTKVDSKYWKSNNAVYWFIFMEKKTADNPIKIIASAHDIWDTQSLCVMTSFLSSGEKLGRWRVHGVGNLSSQREWWPCWISNLVFIFVVVADVLSRQMIEAGRMRRMRVETKMKMKR